MASITLFNGFKVEAQPGPSHSKIFPPDQANKILSAFHERSNGGWLEYSRNPDKAKKRLARIKRKAMYRPFKKKPNGHGQIQFLEGIRRRGGPRG
jgi:hypothetical protein